MNENLKPAIKFCIDIFCALFALSLSYIFLYNFDFVWRFQTIIVLSEEPVASKLSPKYWIQLTP